MSGGAPLRLGAEDCDEAAIVARLSDGGTYLLPTTFGSSFGTVGEIINYNGYDEIHQKMNVNTSSRDETFKIVDKIAVKSAKCLLSNAIFLHISFHPGTTFISSSTCKRCLRYGKDRHS